MLKPITDGHQLEPAIKHQNLARQYDFMKTAYVLWLDQERPHVTDSFLKDLNFYAAHSLSNSPGQYRDTTKENVRVGDHIPPPWEDVGRFMNDFFGVVLSNFEKWDALSLAAYALWRLNWVHPFRQGNGRTARAISYFLICQKYRAWFPGRTIVPEQIRRNRDEYCELLRNADKAMNQTHETDLDPLKSFINRMLKNQINEHLADVSKASNENGRAG